MIDLEERTTKNDRRCTEKRTVKCLETKVAMAHLVRWSGHSCFSRLELPHFTRTFCGFRGLDAYIRRLEPPGRDIQFDDRPRQLPFGGGSIVLCSVSELNSIANLKYIVRVGITGIHTYVI